MKLKQSLRAALFAISLAACLAPATGRAQSVGVWNNNDSRDYYGTPSMLGIPYWSYGAVPPTQSSPNGYGGNWGGVPYPGSGGVTSAVLGAPGDTYCDVQVSLNSLTINPGGKLLMHLGSSLTVASTNVATDGVMDQDGGGIFTNAGTFRKSAGTGLYTINASNVFNSQPGSVIQVDSGSLQLSGAHGVIEGTTFNTAAGTVIDLVSAAGNNIGIAFCRGTLANTTGVGTVRLSANELDYDFHTGQAVTFNFPGTVFQWTGGIIGGNGSGEVPPFYNVGTMNLSGDNVKTSYAVFTNQGLTTQSGLGNLDLANDTFTNAAGATYDLQSDAAVVTSGGGAFINSGLFKKSAGTGTSTLTAFFSHQGGTVEVDSGTLLLPTVQGNYINATLVSTGGTFIVGANALLDLGAKENFGGTYTGSGAGTVVKSAGVTPLDQHNTYPTVFNFPAGLFQWTGGTIGDSYTELFTNTGTINLPGAGGVAVNAQFTNAGTMIQTGAGDFSANDGVLITNAAGALFDLRSDAGISTTARVKVANAGTLQKSAGTGTSTVSPNFTNTGTVAVLTGTLDFSYYDYSAALVNGTLPSGTWTVANGAALTFSGYPKGVTVNQATVVLNGANAQFPAINPLTDNQGTFSLLAQRQFTSAGALSNEGTLNLDAGSTLHVSGAYTGSGASTVAFTVGGTQSQGAQSAGVLQVNGAATLGGTLSVKLGAGVQLKTTDTITVMAATGGLTGSFANVVNGERLNTADGTGSFQVNYGSGSAFNAKTVVLSGFTASGVVTHPAFFTGEEALGQNVYYLAFPGNGNIFGYYQYYYAADPHFIYHFDLGFEYWFDAADGHDGIYFYDFKSSDFFYTSPTFPFPYLYDFGLQAFLYYYPDPNNPGRYNTNGVRYFYNFAAGKIISK